MNVPLLRAAALCFLLGCSEAGMDPGPERVGRLRFEGVEPSVVSTGRVTHYGLEREVPFRTTACLDAPAPRELGVEFAARASARGASLRFGRGSTGESSLGGAWRALRVTLPAGTRCLELAAAGPARSRISITRPLVLEEGHRRPWVVLYVVDTWRFDRSPFAGDERLGPAFAAFARDAVVYERAFATSSWTRPTVATLLTGLYPGAHHVHDRQDRLPDSVARLPGALARAGWETAAFSTNPNILPLWGFLPGFDRFVDVDSGEWLATADFEPLQRAVEAFVSPRADRPVFLYVHDNEPHSPYLPPERFRALLDAPAPGSPGENPKDPSDAAQVAAALRLYEAEVRSTSERFGELLETLKRLGRYEDALIVLVADHGEEFADHGALFHGHTLHQEQLHVPLALKLPGRAGGARVSHPVSTVDVVPTLGAALGVALPAGLPGRVLPLPEEDVEPRLLLAELGLDGRRASAVVRWPWKHLQQGDRVALFDLSRDPGEALDRAEAEAERSEELRRAFERHAALHRSGLLVSCVAGAAPQKLHLVLEIDGSAEFPSPVEALDLEGDDRIEPGAGRIDLRLGLRPALGAEDPSVILVPRRAALAQPDRDRVRLELPAGARFRLAASGAAPKLEGGGGPLGLPLEAAAGDFVAPGADPDPVPGREAGCRLTFTPAADRLPERDLDPNLRERLRALGYLD